MAIKLFEVTIIFQIMIIYIRKQCRHTSLYGKIDFYVKNSRLLLKISWWTSCIIRCLFFSLGFNFYELFLLSSFNYDFGVPSIIPGILVIKYPSTGFVQSEPCIIIHSFCVLIEFSRIRLRNSFSKDLWHVSLKIDFHIKSINIPVFGLQMCSFQLQAVNIFDCLGQEMLNFPKQVFLFVILLEIPVVRAFAVMFTGSFKKLNANIIAFRTFGNLRISLYLNAIPNSTHLWVITEFVIRVRSQVSLVEQELIILPEHLSSS